MERVSTSPRPRWRARVGTGLPALLLALGWQALASAGPDRGDGILSGGFPGQALQQPAAPLAQAEQAPRTEKDRIIEIAKKRYEAEVVGIKETTVRGRRAYALRLLLKGKTIIDRNLDAETGAEL